MGVDGSQADLSTVEEYDPATDKWARKKDMPMVRRVAGTCAVKDRIFLVGGEDDARVKVSRVEEYDPATDTWKRRPDMQVPRRDPSVIALGDTVYAIGGAFHYFMTP